MKVNARVEKGFNPVDINITLETEEELNAFYCMFNHSRIIDASGMGVINADAVRDVIKNELGKTPEYRDQWEKLDRYINGKEK
jgi:hypothetical protein